jgi:OOP family OmpA-OmpF porin
MRWAIPAAIGAVALIVLNARANARFNRAVAVLKSEPGLVVIDARRGWRDWEISGLRDPQARTPEAALAGVGMVPRALLGSWESYLSLDSAVVAVRARQAWGLPATTALSLRGDTATITGELPLWSIGLIRQEGMPAGIHAVVLSDTRITLPPYLDSIRAVLLADRVLFASGEAEVFGPARAGIRLAATRFRILDDSVTAHSADVTLTVVGRTDPTGSDAMNQALAQWRVDRVAAIFAESGVRTQRLRGEALATARPLESDDPAEQARINRSVSFEIDVSARPRVPREQ